MSILFIHGYGATSNATKAQILRDMFPREHVTAPTIDYDRLPPQAVHSLLRDIVSQESPRLILGSSMGGYHAICCTLFYRGPVWCVNPVGDIAAAMALLPPPAGGGRGEQYAAMAAAYRDFDREVFARTVPAAGQLCFALSSDDELLGDHTPLLSRFPDHGTVVWKAHCGHHFRRFRELKPLLAQALGQQQNGSR